jgi:hypothetical protein
MCCLLIKTESAYPFLNCFWLSMVARLCSITIIQQDFAWTGIACAEVFVFPQISIACRLFIRNKWCSLCPVSWHPPFHPRNNSHTNCANSMTLNLMQSFTRLRLKYRYNPHLNYWHTFLKSCLEFVMKFFKFTTVMAIFALVRVTTAAPIDASILHMRHRRPRKLESDPELQTLYLDDAAVSYVLVTDGSCDGCLEISNILWNYDFCATFASVTNQT